MQPVILPLESPLCRRWTRGRGANPQARDIRAQPGLTATARLPAVPPTHLLYLHGFRSSPQSFKARRLAGWFAANRPDLHWWCPQLPPSPCAAMTLLREGTAAWPAASSVVIGSSLGGFYAALISDATGWPAVLLNPAVDPARDLAAHIGFQTAFHAPDDPRASFHFKPEYVAELQAMALPQVSRPERNLAIIAKGDQVLDWREMSARHAGAQMRLLEGSDHGLSDFDEHLPHLLAFLQVKPSTAT